MNQKGFAAIYILLTLLLVGTVGGLYFVQQKTQLFSKASSNNTDSGEQTQNTESIPSATPTTPPHLSIFDRLKNSITSTTTTTNSVSPSNNNSKTVQPSPSKTPTPTASSPTASPTNTPTPTQVTKGVCSINVIYGKIDGSLNTNLRLVTLVYSFSISTGGNVYMAGAQWDFDGNGSWDTGLDQVNGTIEHTYDHDGSYNVRLQLKDSRGIMTDVCTKNITIPSGTTAHLTGTVYADSNCNNIREPSESGIPGVSVDIYRMPDFTRLTTLTTDSNGNYSLSPVIPPGGSLTIQPYMVSPWGYSNPFNFSTYTLGGSQMSINRDIAQVPSPNIGSCSQ